MPALENGEVKIELLGCMDLPPVFEEALVGQPSTLGRLALGFVGRQDLLGIHINPNATR